MIFIVLVDPGVRTLVPAEAIEFLRGEVQYTEEMPVVKPDATGRSLAHAGNDASGVAGLV